MEKKYRYLIQLTPISSYFFGGENTFGEGKSASYFAKSNRYPSQATLLGVMRYEILRQRNLLGLSDRNQCEQIIGPRSFSIDEAVNVDGKMDFGIIDSLSPLFLQDRKTNSFFTAMPLDEGVDLGWETERCYLSGIQSTRMLISANFEPKNYDNYLYYVNPEKKRLDEILEERCEGSKIFQVVEQIGITKNKKERHDTDDDAYFKQELVVLHPDLCFACTMATKQPLQIGSTMVFMGAYRSVFKLEISQPDFLPDFCASGSENYFAPLSRADRYLLLSDAYLQSNVWRKADFIWGEAVDFRSIKSHVKDGLSWKKPEKGCLYHLQAKGSVLLGKDLDACLTLPALQQIGLNLYVKPIK